MLNALKKHWFFFGIAVAILLAFAVPALGRFVHEYSVLKIGVFFAFLISGLTLDTSSIVQQLRDVKVLVAAIVSSLVFIPVIAFGLGQVVFSASPDLVVGICIIMAAPVTVAAGTVMTSIARGNVPLSLFICVATNFVAVLTIPFTLDLLLQTAYNVELPIPETITRLVITVLIPTTIGQLIRAKFKETLLRHKKFFSLFQQSVVLLIIFNAVSGSSQKIIDAGIVIVYVIGFMIVLHLLFLAMNYVISRGIGLDRPSTAAFTIHTSQKTLTVSYLVWASHFATLFPMALIPGIAYHLTQNIIDTFVAQAFQRRHLEPQAARGENHIGMPGGNRV